VNTLAKGEICLLRASFGLAGMKTGVNIFAWLLSESSATKLWATISDFMPAGVKSLESGLSSSATKLWATISDFMPAGVKSLESGLSSFMASFMASGGRFSQIF